MNNIEVLNYLTNKAKDYRLNCNKFINNNNHMNELGGGASIDQKYIDAILVDFINYIGCDQGVDYALHTCDLLNKESK